MSSGRNKRQRNNQNSESFNQSSSQQSQQSQYNQPSSQSEKADERQEQNKKREVIKVNHKDAHSYLYKDITFYEYLLVLDVDSMCKKLYDIMSYENSLPELDKENEDLIIFMKFIQKLIFSIKVLKEKQDLESSQKQMSLLKDTAIGFLSSKDFENSIFKRLNQNSGKTLKNKKILLNSEQSIEFNSVLQDIIQYVKDLDNSIFSQIRNYYDLPVVLDFQILEDLLQSQDLDQQQYGHEDQVFEFLQQIQNQLLNLTLKDNKQTLTIFQFISFLIRKQKNVGSDKQQIYYQCIINCLKIKSLIDRVQNFSQQNLNQEQKHIIIISLQDIGKYKTKAEESNLIKSYKLALFSIYENTKSLDDDSMQANADGEIQQEETEFDEDLMQQIADEFDIIQKLVDYKKNIDLETNVLPSDSDCRNVKNYRGFLKKIQLKSKYQGQLEYLENMFNFLRADSHQELVIGMNLAIKIGQKINLENIQTFEDRQQELLPFKELNSQFNFYNNLEIVNIKLEKGIVFTLQIMPILPKKNMKLRLEQTKRLIGGQFLYLTDYNFNKLYVCELLNDFVNKDIQKVDSEYNIMKIKVKILDESNQIGTTIENIKEIISNQEGFLIEPKLYYGQYISCMTAIKNMITNKYKLPFQNNLIHLEKKISMPSFVNEDTKYYLDFTPLNQFQNELDQEEMEQYMNNTKSTNGIFYLPTFKRNNGYQQKLFSEWKDIPTLNFLNQSQVRAVKNILTKEISIIQGPPGTGKTYVGAMAVRNLLQNSEVWNPDKNVILMCCKTNHALDQFLTHIIKFETDVVRVGARTKSEEIKEYELQKLKQQYCIQKQSFFSSFSIEKKLNESLNYFSDKLFEKENCEKLIKMLPEDIVKICCKLFLIDFYPALPFLAINIDTIIEDKQFYEILAVCWWQLNPDIIYIRDNLFYPLIQKYEQPEYQEISQQSINYHLPSYYNLKENLLYELYRGKYTQKKSETNYFYRDSSDDTIDEKINSQQYDSNIEYLWRKILFSRSNQAMKDKLEKEIDVDEQEYAEDRENYEVNDAGYEDDYELDESETDNQKKKKKQKRKEEKKNEEFCQTYFQFFGCDLEHIYEQIELHLRSEDEQIKYLDIFSQIYLRLKAISLYAQQTKQNLFSREEMENYERQLLKLKEEDIFADITIMKKKKIVAMTLGGICKYSEYLKYLKYDIVLIEEAAEVLENLSVPLFQPFLKQVILIGDHQQLKPTVNSFFMEKKYNMNVSLFQRLVVNELEYVCLNEQMRMCPEFSEYVKLIYDKPNQYLDNQKVLQYDRKVRGLPSNIMFFMHSYNELQLNYTTTKKNEQEANLAVGLAKYILKQRQYTSDQITILSMYLGQALMIKKLLNNNEDLKNIRVSTIDNYQGEENEIIILSLVRSSAKEMGFVKIENRINVSISRAKKGFIVLGNKNLLQTYNTLWKKIFDKAKKNNHIFYDKFTVQCPQHNKNITYSDPNSFSMTPNGGCEQKCKQQNLSCKHQCKYKCHGGSCDEYGCQEPVEVIFDKCLHKNKVKCCMLSKKEEWICEQMINQQNPVCNHEMSIQCYKYDYKNKQIKPEYESDIQKIKCNKFCGKQLQCGHKCEQECHFLKQTFCDPYQCQKTLNKTLNCGHEYRGKCGNLLKSKCQVKVEKKTLPCGHYAKNVSCSFITKCQQQCSKILECGHKCNQQYCYQPHACGQKSKRKLACGHFVIEQCQKDLSGYKCNEISGLPLACGHGINTNICCEADKFKCQHQVTVELDCGHLVQAECYLSNKKDLINCDQTCSLQLQCGHNCQNRCGQECTEECMYQVSNRKRKNCEHLYSGVCHQIYQPCKEPKQFQNKVIKCYEFQNLNVTCNKLLQCGHRCKQKTFDRCICKEKIDLQCCNQQIYCFEKRNHNCNDDNFI